MLHLFFAILAVAGFAEASLIGRSPAAAHRRSAPRRASSIAAAATDSVAPGAGGPRLMYCDSLSKSYDGKR
jgi:hypothetical protein